MKKLSSKFKILNSPHIPLSRRERRGSETLLRPSLKNLIKTVKTQPGARNRPGRRQPDRESRSKSLKGLWLQKNCEIYSFV
jgi:hypothetical protein